MKLLTRNPSRDPSRVREVLRQLCDELIDALGADLESIVLYGSFARANELETEHDTVNVMLVLRSVACHTLDKMASAIARVEREIPLTTMTLTREDLHSSCDVFPIKFHDMQLYHRVLSGEDVLSDLEISDVHLRIRCEQQLKNLMLRLRAIYLHRNQNSSQLLETLLEANRSFLQDIHACLVVKTGIVPEDDTDLAAAFGEEFGLDTKVVNEVLGIRVHAAVPKAEDLKRTFDRFMQLVHDSALAVDQMETQS
jgi:predicted nucleotidyltransferase